MTENFRENNWCFVICRHFGGLQKSTISISLFPFIVFSLLDKLPRRKVLVQTSDQQGHSVRRMHLQSLGIPFHRIGRRYARQFLYCHTQLSRRSTSSGFFHTYAQFINIEVACNYYLFLTCASCLNQFPGIAPLY